jgi:hypothetical protein
MTVGERDLDNWVRFDEGPNRTWGQDREAMAKGHFSGFTGCIVDEDLVIQASQGVIQDRTKEHLCSSDVGIGRLRRRLLDEIAAWQNGLLAIDGADPRQGAPARHDHRRREVLARTGVVNGLRDALAAQFVRIGYVAVNVRDVELSRAFYEAVTPMRVVARTQAPLQPFTLLGRGAGQFRWLPARRRQRRRSDHAAPDRMEGTEAARHGQPDLLSRRLGQDRL